MKNLHTQMEFFYNTKNWKNYWVNGLKELIKGKVMDIGTGIGSNLPFYLNLKTIKKLVCLEPDIKLYKKIKKKFHKTKKNKIFFKNTDLLKKRLTKHGHNVITANNGNEALIQLMSSKDEIDVIQFIQKTIKDRRNSALDILGNNGIKSMEEYQKLMGEISALSYIEQELSGLIDKQELFDD